MRRLLLGAVLSLALTSASFGTADVFDDPPSIEERNASGFDYFMLEVPDGTNLTMDGSDGDWGFFDPSFVLTIQDFRDEADRPLPSREDLDITTKMAWKGGSENRWYVFMHIHDDILRHDGTSTGRWSGDMLGFALQPTDHGREDGTGWSMQVNATPGDLDEPDNYELRRVDPAPLGDYDDDPWMVGAIRVEPQEAWVTTEQGWTSDTGGDVYYEWNMVVIDFLDDGGPGASTITQLDNLATENGAGLPFAFWVEDGDPIGEDLTAGGFNDMTTRGPVGAARQYWSHATLLTVDEYAVQSPTAVEASTWGRIKSSF